MGRTHQKVCQKLEKAKLLSRSRSVETNSVAHSPITWMNFTLNRKWMKLYFSKISMSSSHLAEANLIKLLTFGNLINLSVVESKWSTTSYRTILFATEKCRWTWSYIKCIASEYYWLLHALCHATSPVKINFVKLFPHRWMQKTLVVGSRKPLELDARVMDLGHTHIIARHIHPLYRYSYNIRTEFRTKFCCFFRIRIGCDARSRWEWIEHTYGAYWKWQKITHGESNVIWWWISTPIIVLSHENFSHSLVRGKCFSHEIRLKFRCKARNSANLNLRVGPKWYVCTVYNADKHSIVIPLLLHGRKISIYGSEI